MYWGKSFLMQHFIFTLKNKKINYSKFQVRKLLILLSTIGIQIQNGELLNIQNLLLNIGAHNYNRHNKK